MATGIYKRNDIYWIRYSDNFGKQHRESSGSTKYSDASALLTSRRKAVDDGKDVEREKRRIGRFTFGQLVEKYIPFCKPLKGFTKKKSVIKQINKKFKYYPLRKLTLVVLEEYQAGLSPKYSTATINKRLSILRHMLSKAVDWDMVESEIRERAYKVKLRTEENSRLRYLQYDEIKRLVNACAPHLKPIVMTALLTGMRRGEILSLRWERVDLVNRIIFLGPMDTKSGRRREIPINELLYKILLALPRKEDVPWVFPSIKPGKGKNKDKAIKATGDVKTAFNAAVRRAGIKDFKFHDLRHTFASHLVMEGKPLPTVSRLLGHSSMTMTMRYAHLAPRHLADAVEVLSTKINIPALPSHDVTT